MSRLSTPAYFHPILKHPWWKYLLDLFLIPCIWMNHVDVSLWIVGNGNDIVSSWGDHADLANIAISILVQSYWLRSVYFCRCSTNFLFSPCFARLLRNVLLSNFKKWAWEPIPESRQIPCVGSLEGRPGRAGLRPVRRWTAKVAPVRSCSWTWVFMFFVWVPFG